MKSSRGSSLRSAISASMYASAARTASRWSSRSSSALENIRSTQSNQRSSSSSGRFMKRASEPSDIGCANSAITSPPPLRAIGSSSRVASASSSGRSASMRGFENSALTSPR